jgi:hypothetical protein
MMRFMAMNRHISLTEGAELRHMRLVDEKS